MDISNTEFLRAIFGDQHSLAHVTSFTQDPGGIPASEGGRCWAGGAFKDTPLIPDSNQFYTVSLFAPDEKGRSRRRKVNFSACYVIGLDDVREKLPIEQVERLPSPSIVIKSSLHSEQWLYLLATPCVDASCIDNLHDGLINNGLVPDSKDPGQKGVTRYLRLPEGCNTKSKRIAENGGAAPHCEVTEWHPERRYTLDQLAAPFGVDLYAPRAEKRVDGAAAIPDHPLLKIPDIIKVKEIRSDGRLDITCPWVDEHTGGADDGAAVFTNKDGTIGFKCHHGSCEGRTGRDLLKWVEEQDPGFTETYSTWQLMREFDKVAGNVAGPVGSSLSMLRSTTANGGSSKMKAQMLKDRYALKDLAIMGQWTVFYAGPNTGKTLITQWLIREAVADGVDGDNVYYVNCDDTYKGGIEKLEIAEEFGFNMLLPNTNNFKPDTLVSTMKGITAEGEAHGVVIILDTLKKFTDLMDKKASSGFGNIAREFVGAGGTLICEAHVNKNKGVDGKSIHTGTSDVPDDADCVYMIEQLASEEVFCRRVHTVEFECIKSRGDVAQSAAFKFTKEKGAGYRTLFESVERAGRADVENAKQALLQEPDAEAIEAVKAALENGQTVKSEIEKFVKVSGVSRNKVRDTLDKYEGQLWEVHKGDKNASIYSLTQAPELQVSFF